MSTTEEKRKLMDEIQGLKAEVFNWIEWELNKTPNDFEMKD